MLWGGAGMLQERGYGYCKEKPRDATERMTLGTVRNIGDSHGHDRWDPRKAVRELRGSSNKLFITVYPGPVLS